MRARLYARVSTEEQALTGFSLSAQRERLDAFCLSQGWAVAGHYVDEGASAKDLNRPQFQRLLADAQPGEVVLVYKLDRLTRSVRDLDDLLRDFERRDIHFRSATEQFDTTTATGRLFIRMVAEMAQWERETIAERSAFGKLKKAQSGEWAGGTVPFGYIAVPSDRVKAGRRLLMLMPDPARHHLIPLIFERYLQGYGVRAIAGWLNGELGLRTLQGKRFHQLTVSRLLQNPIYCGDIEHGRGPGGLKIRTPGTHEPLVSRQIFDQVQAQYVERRADAPRQATGAYPLSGVARCGICGGRIDGHRRSDRRGARVYRCHNYMTGAGCGQGRALASVSAEPVEVALLRLIERLPTPTELGRYLAALAGEAGPSASAEARRAARDLAQAEVAIDRWKRLFEQGHIEMDEYLAEVRPHQARIRHLQERLAAPAPAAVPVYDLRQAWAALEPQERKALLRHLADAFGLEIRLHPGRRVELRPSGHIHQRGALRPHPDDGPGTGRPAPAPGPDR